MANLHKLCRFAILKSFSGNLDSISTSLSESILIKIVTKTETPILRLEMEKEKIPYATVWFPINLENRIIELLNLTDM